MPAYVFHPGGGLPSGLRDTGALVGVAVARGTDVAVGGSGVAVGAGVAVGGMGVAVAGAEVAVDGMGVGGIGMSAVFPPQPISTARPHTTNALRRR